MGPTIARMHLRTTLPLFLLALFVGWTMLAPPRRPTSDPKRAPVSVVGNPEVVQQAYENFRRDRMARADGAIIEIGLGFWKGLMPKRTDISGTVAFDLKAATASITLQGGSQDALEVWAVENVEGPGRSISPDSGDRMIRLASIQPGEVTRVRTVSLGEVLESDLALDLVAVTPAGRMPDEVIVAAGAATLFDRLYVSELRSGDQARSTTRLSGLLLSAMPQPPGWGGGSTGGGNSGGGGPLIPELVTLGEQIFFNETFEGNGRTCGTCHPAENNFTLDREFITTLDPGNPLFVAEFTPELNESQNGGLRFETPDLMHQFGLITINPDGFDDLAHKFVLRAVSHTFAQGLQLTRPDPGEKPPMERLGWSGDGSPGDGTLRSFAIGAVVQHFPKTLGRQENADFRLPSEDELDALEAFQLSLGRQSELDFSVVTFTDPQVEAGKSHFEQGCGFCHGNGGANSFFSMGGIGSGQTPLPGTNLFNHPLANGNFDTGVEARAQHADIASGFEIPHDGGFGTEPGFVPVIGAGPEPFGDGSFNISSVIEFADTVPGFHNHLPAFPDMEPELGSDPVEAVVKFYQSSAFTDSPAAAEFGLTPGVMNGLDSARIALFLRSINGARNARDAQSFATKAIALIGNAQNAGQPLPEQELARLAQLAMADLDDGLQVLSQASIYPLAVQDFQDAINMVNVAADVMHPVGIRLARWQQAESKAAGIPAIIGTGL